jgi:hypothetical protein
VTLIEVLIAIFVMGIGMLALLVLFPLGALSIARALQDDRAAQAAANATAVANALDVRHDPLVTGAFTNPFPGSPLTLPPSPPGVPPPPPLDAQKRWSGPGYPVFIDPYYANSGGSFATVGQFAAAVTPGIPRKGLTGFTPALTIRWFTLLDDITFTSGELADGTPGPAGTTVKRGGRYTWAYLVKSPRVNSPEVIDLSVVVYNGRAVQVPALEQTYVAVGDAGSNVITVAYSGEKPQFRKGVWILDVTYESSLLVPHGDFYRVIGTTDIDANTIQLEIQGTLKAKLPAPVKDTPSGAIVLMDNVVEVFDRGSGWRP